MNPSPWQPICPQLEYCRSSAGRPYRWREDGVEPIYLTADEAIAVLRNFARAIDRGLVPSAVDVRGLLIDERARR